jgi:predicted nucleotide-binding protein
LTLAPDDAVIARGHLSMAPRDNVLCELGLLIGRLGWERTFFVYDKIQDAKVPTDPIKRLVKMGVTMGK